jgi:hypothetical protein
VTCGHDERRPTAKRDSLGRVTVVMQCPCGAALGILKYADLNGLSLGELPPFDEAAHEALRDAQYQAAQARRDFDRRMAQDSAPATPAAPEFWESYTAYLDSPAWREKRDLVLRRDGGRCRARLFGCRGTASEVHHIRYTHVGREPLFDLEAVCSHCHRDLTVMDRKGRRAEQVFPAYGRLEWHEDDAPEETGDAP